MHRSIKYITKCVIQANFHIYIHSALVRAIIILYDFIIRPTSNYKYFNARIESVFIIAVKHIIIVFRTLDKYYEEKWWIHAFLRIDSDTRFILRSTYKPMRYVLIETSRRFNNVESHYTYVDERLSFSLSLSLL